MNYLATAVLVLGALTGKENVKPASAPTAFLPVSVSLENAGWTWPQKEGILIQEREIKVGELLEGKLPKGEKPDRLRYTWVVIDGPIDCPFGKKVGRGITSGNGDEQALVFRLLDGKVRYVSFQEGPIKAVAGEGFEYVATSKAKEKLYILQLRVDLMQADRVVLSGYTAAQAFVVFKKVP